MAIRHAIDKWGDWELLSIDYLMEDDYTYIITHLRYPYPWVHQEEFEQIQEVMLLTTGRSWFDLSYKNI